MQMGAYGAIPKRRPLNSNMNEADAEAEVASIKTKEKGATIWKKFEDNPDLIHIESNTTKDANRLPKEVSSQSNKPNSNLDAIQIENLGKF